MATVFFDTNVLVYTADNRDERKQRIARNLIKDALNGRLNGWISVQTLLHQSAVHMTCGRDGTV